MDGVSELTQGLLTLSYLGGKVRECDEEVASIRKNLEALNVLIVDNWKGYAAESCLTKIEEVSQGVRRTSDYIGETLLLLNTVSTQMEEDLEKAKEKEKEEKEKEEKEEKEKEESDKIKK